MDDWLSSAVSWFSEAFNGDDYDKSVGSAALGLFTGSALKLAGGALADRAAQRQIDDELDRARNNQNVGSLKIGQFQPSGGLVGSIPLRKG